MKGPPPATVASCVMLPFARLLVRAAAQNRRAILNETEALLASSGLSWQGILDRTVQRIPQRLSVAMLETSVRLSGDEALGLHGAEASQPGDLKLLEYLVRSCATVGDSLEVWRRYLPLVLDADLRCSSWSWRVRVAAANPRACKWLPACQRCCQLRLDRTAPALRDLPSRCARRRPTGRADAGRRARAAGSRRSLHRRPPLAARPSLLPHANCSRRRRQRQPHPSRSHRWTHAPRSRRRSRSPRRRRC